MSEHSIFLRALDIEDSAERAKFLDEACAGDQNARRELDALLEAHGRTGSFLEGPAHDTPTKPYEPPERPGSHVGPYKLLQRIGEGGMGVVYMAEQVEPVRRTVAVKIIRGGMDSRSMLARFEAERQALAMMDHPNIAHVFDVGTTESGLPFFVMELVKGVPITRFCDDKRLGLRERLELFVPVCQAIQHAHQKGVIHRDIKPSNVLVAQYDDRPVPKVIDFGVAKAMNQKLTERTLFTAFGSVVGTLEYMSPEQAKLNQLDIDTRSDVYALGVLLYELLTGSTPIDRARLKAAALDEVLRIIREEEPARPSTRLSAARTQPATQPASPAGAPAACERSGQELRGELDWIVMKALEKDRARRYETANGLARDVQRYLKDEPVEACPPTLAYRVKKFYRKNRAAVAVAAGFAVLLGVSAVGSTMLAVSAMRAERIAAVERDRAEANAIDAEAQRKLADRERQRAEEEKRSAEAVRNFLQTDLLGQASDFLQAESRRLSGASYEILTNPSIGELLDRAASQLTPEQIEKKFPAMPFVQAEVLRTVGNSYLAINHPAKALPLLRRSVELASASRGPSDPITLEARQLVAVALDRLGQYDEAQAGFDAVVRDRSQALGPFHPDTLVSKINQGTIFFEKNRRTEALNHFRTLSADARTHLGPEHVIAIWAEANHAIALRFAGRMDEAIRRFEALHPLLNSLGGSPLFDHPGFMAGTLELADLYRAAGRRGDANALLRKTLAATEAALGPEHPATWAYRHEIAHEHMRVKEIDAALALFEINVKLDTAPDFTMSSHESLGFCHEAAGRLDAALDHYQRSLNLQIAKFGPEHRSWSIARRRARIGQCLMKKGQYTEAEPFLRDGYRGLLEFANQTPPWDATLLQEVRTSLLDVYQTLGRSDDAKQLEQDWVEELRGRLDRTTKNSGSTLLDQLRAAALLSNELVKFDRKEEVAPIFKEALVRILAADCPVGADYLSAYERLRHAVSVAGSHLLAAELSEPVVKRLRELPSTPRETLNTEVFALASHWLWGDRREEAEPLLRESLAMQADLDPQSWQLTKRMYFLGTNLFWLKKYDEAEQILKESYEQAVARLDAAPNWEKDYPKAIANRLAALYAAIGRESEANLWRERASK